MCRASLLLAILPLLAYGGQVRVAVRDGSKAAVVNAQVAAACAGGEARETRSGDGGVAVLADVPDGECQVTVRAPGFQEWRGAANTGQPVTAQLMLLRPGTKVDVNGARPKSPVSRFVGWLTSCTRR